MSINNFKKESVVYTMPCIKCCHYSVLVASAGGICYKNKAYTNKQ